jgi:hypothetical protein
MLLNHYRKCCAISNEARQAQAIKWPGYDYKYAIFLPTNSHRMKFGTLKTPPFFAVRLKELDL